ncbi:MAG: type II secretion system protein [Elusimicrobia bacterium]|nr:type II secretion system protein [Elusimicrobiota bacterium]
MKRSGFTLVELLIVLVIMGILLGIAAVKYAGLMRKANEGALQGNLGALRSALSIYYGDMAGKFPSSLDSLTANAKYLPAIPKARAPDYHPESAAVSAGVTDDASGWGYDNDPASSRFGTVWVNCTHTDTKGSVWSSY